MDRKAIESEAPTLEACSLKRACVIIGFGTPAESLYVTSHSQPCSTILNMISEHLAVSRHLSTRDQVFL